MANITLNSYLHQINVAWDDIDADKIARLLSLQDPHIQSEKLLVDNFEEEVYENLPNQLAEMVNLHLKVLKSMQEQKYDEALTLQCQLGHLLCKILQSQKDENSLLLTMEVVCQDLRRIANLAYKFEDPIGRTEDQSSSMEKAADVLMALFRVCAADSRTLEYESKRLGMLVLVNNLFKIYFRINRLHLCKPLIRAIESLNLKEKFPIHQIVTYKYYTGRKAMFDSEFKEAEECLTLAFKNSATLENKKKILTYLVPVKMFLGWLPTKEALEKYNLIEFENVSEALKEGNVRKFNEALVASEQKFIRAGIYLILEKLRTLLYRNLLKKTCFIYESHQVPLGVLEAALKWSGYEDIAEHEIHCIVANLIFDGQIRGYISNQHQMLVVAKNNAFPKISISGD